MATGHSVTSNGRVLPWTPHYVGTLASSDVTAPDATLRAALAREGYLLLPDVVPVDTLRALRRAYYSLFDPVLLAGGDAERGAFSGTLPHGLPSHGVPGHPAHSFVRSDTFKAFADLPLFRQLAERLLGGPVKRLARTPLRHFIRGHSKASRAHVDRSYLDCPSEANITFWIPLADCPVEAGGLVYLERSHEDPAMADRLKPQAPTDRPDDARPLTHDLRWLADATHRRWLAADVRAGDLVVHTPDIVHASLDSTSDQMRLSTDLRFVRDHAPSDPRWQDDWAADDGY
jgi:hypothetical protein